jgi:AAA domain (dynein-related subfamily)
MGFRRVSKSRLSLPQRIRDLNFEQLHGSQMWVLADFVGARRAMQAAKGVEARRAILKQFCLDNEERAQKGYEIVVLQKDPSPAGAAVAPDVEKRMYEVLTDVVEKHRESIEEKASVAVAAQVSNIEKRLEAHAKEAVRIAAESRAPIMVNNKGKIHKVKGVLQPEFKRIVELASAGIPIMLVGPAGCGKTFLGAKVAEALDLDFSDQSCSEGMSEAVFNGRLLPIGKGGAFVHVPSPFMIRYEKGGVMLMDEMDAGDANLFTYANKSIANESYTAEVRYDNPVVKKHKDFVIMGACNTYGNGADAMYVGRNQLDAATLDRFKVGMITMDYSRDVEASLASDDLCQWAWAIREKIRALRLKRIMSTRVIKDLSTMTKMYSWKQDEWNAAYFTGWTEAEKKLVLA